MLIYAELYHRSLCYNSLSKPIVKRSTICLFILYLQFKELTYGLQKTNASTLLRSCLEYVMNHYIRFLPGEGGYLLDLLQDVRFYCECWFMFNGLVLYIFNVAPYPSAYTRREIDRKRNLKQIKRVK